MNIFIHIPKTAGNSVRESLSVQGVDYLDIGHSNLSNQSINYKEHFSFCFVRNPYSRLKSAFYHLVDIDLEKARGSTSRFLRRRAELRDKYGFDYEGFVLDRGFELFDFSHFYPQVKWIYQEGKRVVNFVGYLEDIDRDFNNVCEILTKKGGGVGRENVTKTSVYKEGKGISKKAQEIIKKYYLEDFLKLGYSFDYSFLYPRKKVGIIYSHANVDDAVKDSAIQSSKFLDNGSNYLFLPASCSSDEGGRDLLIILSTHNQRKTYFGFEKLLHCQKYDLLFMTDVANGYYLADDEEKNIYIEFISKVLKEGRYNFVTIFGSSMAGFGALKIGSALNLNIFVTNPQVDLGLTEEVAWPDLKKTLESLDFKPSIASDLGGEGSYIYCVYGGAKIDAVNMEALGNVVLSSSNIIMRRINDPSHSFPFPDNLEVINQVHEHLRFLKKNRL